MNISVILCTIAGLFGVYALIKWFCILRSDVYTSWGNALPVMITTIAWLSAAVTFYQTDTHDRPIDGQRLFMIIGYILLLHRLKVYRDNHHKQLAKTAHKEDL